MEITSLQIFLLLTGFLLLAITLFTYRGKRDAVRQAFLLMGTGSSCWVISLVLMQITRNFLFDKVIFFNAFMTVGGLFLVAKTFPEHTGSMPRHFYLYLIPFAMLTMLLPFNLFIEGAIFHPDGTMEPINGPAFPLAFITFLGYLLGSLGIFIKKLRSATGIIKVQMRYLFLGIAASVIGFITNALLPALGVYQFNVLGALSGVIFVGFISYTIIRHRFLDIRIVIRRGMLYSIALGLVATMYFLGIVVFENFFRQGVGAASSISGLITAIVAVFCFPYFENIFQKATNKLFFKGTYEYSEVVKELTYALSSNIDAEKLIGSVDEILRKALKIEMVVHAVRRPDGAFRVISRKSPITRRDLGKKLQDSVVRFLETNRGIVLYQELDYDMKHSSADARTEDLKNIRDALGELKVSAVVPLSWKDELVGITLLGERLSGDPFSTRDIALLNTFSYQAGIMWENVRLYEEIKEYSNELEKKVEKRTRELRKLYNAHSQFMADASHSLQNPLTIIKGNLALLSREAPKRAFPRKILETINRTLDQASSTVDDLLILAKVDFGKYQLEKRVVSLASLLEEIYEDCKVLSEEKDIRCTFRKKSASTVLGDAEKLRELFLNILSNALKNTSRGRIEITIREKGKRVFVEFRDTGQGIPAKDLPFIFNRFYRITRKNMPRDKGAGLGLAICKAIVEAHGGTISAVSSPRVGSVFTITLPVHK